MSEDAPFKFVDLAKLIVQTHSTFESILPQPARPGDEDRWDEVQNNFSWMLNMIKRQIPLLQAEFGRISSERDSLHEQEIADLQRQLQLCEAKISMQKVAVNAAPNNDKGMLVLEQENTILKRQNAQLQSQLQESLGRVKACSDYENDLLDSLRNLTEENQRLGKENEQLREQLDGERVTLSGSSNSSQTSETIHVAPTKRDSKGRPFSVNRMKKDEQWKS